MPWGKDFVAHLRLEALRVHRSRELYGYLLLPSLVGFPVFVAMGLLVVSILPMTRLAIPEDLPPDIALLDVLLDHQIRPVPTADPAGAFSRGEVEAAITDWSEGEVGCEDPRDCPRWTVTAVARDLETQETLRYALREAEHATLVHWLALAGADEEGLPPTDVRWAQSPRAQPGRAIWPEGVALIDLDGDESLDLVADNHRLLTRYRASGNPRLPFTHAGDLVDGMRFQWGDYLAAGDVDADGDTDLLARKGGGPVFFRNQGAGVFVPEPFPVQPTWDGGDGRGGALLCDLDSDGDFDAVLTSPADAPQHVVRNDGTAGFAVLPEPVVPGVGYDGIACGDVDNDGDPDLFLSHEHHSVLLENLGDLTFREVTGVAWADADAEGVLFADLDRDGDLDLVVATLRGPKLWTNLWDDGQSLFVRVLRDGSDAIGATARLYDAETGTPLSGLREVNGGRGHGSQDAPLLHFGLPWGVDRPVRIEVRSLESGVRSPESGAILAKRVVVPAECPGNTVTISIGAASPIDTGTELGPGEAPRRWDTTRPAGSPRADRDGPLWRDDTTVAELPRFSWSNAGGIATADLDRDGLLDLAMHVGNGTHLYRNSGDRTFEDVTERWHAGRLRGLPGCRAILLADVNRDTEVDLVRTDGGAIEIWLNQGEDASGERAFGNGDHPSQVLGPWDLAVQAPSRDPRSSWRSWNFFLLLGGLSYVALWVLPFRIVDDRRSGFFESLAATPSSLTAHLAARIAVLATLQLLSFGAICLNVVLLVPPLAEALPLTAPEVSKLLAGVVFFDAVCLVPGLVARTERGAMNASSILFFCGAAAVWFRRGDPWWLPALGLYGASSPVEAWGAALVTLAAGVGLVLATGTLVPRVLWRALLAIP